MDSSDYTAIGARIAVLERRVRRLKLVLLGCGVLALGLSGFAGALAAQNALHFQNASASVKLSASGLSFYDANTRLRMDVAAVLDGGRPRIRLIDSAKTERVFYSLTGSGQPQLLFDDTLGNQRLFVGLTTQSTGLVRTFTTSEKIQTSLEDTFMRVRDNSGVEQLVVGVSTANSPVLKMFDTSGTYRLFAGVYSNAASGFTAYGTTGSSIWSSP